MQEQLLWILQFLLQRMKGARWANESMNELTEVTPNLFVCGKFAINDADIERLGITLIINSAKELENYKPVSTDLSPMCVKIPVQDNPDAHLYPYFMVYIFRNTGLGNLFYYILLLFFIQSILQNYFQTL